MAATHSIDNGRELCGYTVDYRAIGVQAYSCRK